MTTTLRPTEPLQRVAGGGCSRHYQVCVNSRPVGSLRVTRSAAGAAHLEDLRIDAADRRRGRATVAALAAEEIARGWGCSRIDVSVPVTAEGGLALATGLGYTERNRGMTKLLGVRPPELPQGSVGRPMTQAEFEPWEARGRENYARLWIERGVPEAEARAKAERDHTRLLPDGVDTADTRLSILEHEGRPVGTLWLALREHDAYVFDVEVGEHCRGQGHGRTLMLLAEADAVEAGRQAIALNVFAGNTPALRLYESLGYRPTVHHFYKPLF